MSNDQPMSGDNITKEEIRAAYDYQLKMAHGIGHYDGCWKDHYPCVLEKLLDIADRQPVEIAALQAKFHSLRGVLMKCVTYLQLLEEATGSPVEASELFQMRTAINTYLAKTSDQCSTLCHPEETCVITDNGECAVSSSASPKSSEPAERAGPRSTEVNYFGCKSLIA